MIDVVTFLSKHAETIEHLTGALKSVATVVALAIGGMWTFRLFIKNRLNKPRAQPTHEVEIRDLGDLGLLVHASVKIYNQSPVLMTIAYGEVRLVPMLPLPNEIVALVREKKSPLQLNDTEIAWPRRQTIKAEWSKCPREIEPSETDTYHFDFIVDRPLSTFQIYSYFRNVSKKRREIGWNTTTIHDV
jgi:hypothetical protein